MPDWGFVAGTTSKVYLKNNSAVQWRIAPPSKVTVRLCSKNTLAVQCAGSTLPAGASEVTGVFNL